MDMAKYTLSSLPVLLFSSALSAQADTEMVSFSKSQQNAFPDQGAIFSYPSDRVALMDAVEMKETKGANPALLLAGAAVAYCSNFYVNSNGYWSYEWDCW